LKKIVRLSSGVEGEKHDDALAKKKTANYRLQVTRRQRYLKKKERSRMLAVVAASWTHFCVYVTWGPTSSTTTATKTR